MRTHCSNQNPPPNAPRGKPPRERQGGYHHKQPEHGPEQTSPRVASLVKRVARQKDSVVEHRKLDDGRESNVFVDANLRMTVDVHLFRGGTILIQTKWKPSR